MSAQPVTVLPAGSACCLWPTCCSSRAPPPLMQALMEKAVVLGMGVNRQSASDALSGG